MGHILNPHNLKVLESFSIVKTLYAFDFDGTLAPIRENPDDVRLEPNVAHLLSRLNQKSGVAILSGRSVADLKKLLPFKPNFLIGNHGIEGMHSEEEMEKFFKLCQSWKQSLQHLPNDCWLEDKGYTLTIHYKQDKEQLLKEILNLNDCYIMDGKNTLNLIPTSGMNKGQALETLMRKNNFHFGFYVGDDKTDETVFAYKNSRLLTVKVGRSPDTYAKYYLNSQSEIEELLSHLNL